MHCDVEVVDRPSKSWKEIKYSDHHFGKDSKRSILVTTYQLVVEKEFHEPVLLSRIGNVPLNRTRVTGPGLCLIKSAYFSEETMFRHMNELLYIMCQDTSINHFSHNGRLKPTILLTVDGGGDERPRNKGTKFAITLLRWLLDLDKIKTISYAEHDSKLHSVERLHSAENYALSQKGEVSSFGAHKFETNEQGMMDLSKLKANMDHAVKDVVDRIDGTPFAEHEIRASPAPSKEEWIFTENYEQMIRNFFAIRQH